MVLARRVNRDVLHQDELIVVLVECGLQNLTRVREQSGEHLLEGTRDTGGRLAKPFAVGILTDCKEQLPHGLLGQPTIRPTDWLWCTHPRPLFPSVFMGRSHDDWRT